jgi:hypothetical protein
MVKLKTRSKIYSSRLPIPYESEVCNKTRGASIYSNQLLVTITGTAYVSAKARLPVSPLFLQGSRRSGSTNGGNHQCSG